MSGMTSRGRAAPLALPLLPWVLMALAGCAAAATGPQIHGPRVVASAPDYATERWSDPWDYAEGTDILLDAPGPAHQVGGRSVTGGRLRFSADRGGYVSPLWVGFPDELPERNSGPVGPIDAARYTHVSISAYASQRTPAALMWFGACREFRDDCLGGRPFTLEQGWHTYAFPVTNTFPGLPQPWAGTIPGLRLAVSPSTPTAFEVDWLRLFQPTATVEVTWDARRGPLMWDSDADRGNNTADRPGWGRVPGATGGSASVQTGVYPPGQYRFYADGADYSEPLMVDAPPLPVIDDPDHTGGEDYATATLGDPWDFSGPSDVTRLGNATAVEYRGGQLHATNTSNDPFVQLRLAAGGIDASRYHRLTVRMTYDGPFGLEDAPGGGTHGRLIWRRADTGDAYRDSRPMVTWTDRSTYSFDLATTPAADVEDPISPIRVGWTGGTATLLRWDPNEDPGARRWHLDDVRLAADDEARGEFTVRWHDRESSSADARVALYYDTDDRGFDGVRIAGDLPNDPAGNSFRWDTSGIPAGRYHLYLESTDGISTSRRYATGPLVVHDVPARARPDARLAGSNRLATAIAVSASSFPAGAPAAVVARADDFPDALAAAPLAAAAGAPLLLSNRDRLDDGVRAELRRLGVTEVYLMGGQVALSTAVEQELAALPGVSVERIAGPNRYATAAEAARTAVALWRASGHAQAGAQALLALGTNFPDALAAGPLAARLQAPLLLTAADAASADTKAVVAELGVETVTVVGGAGAVPDEVARDAAGAGTVVDRIAGPGRYDTAARLAAAAVAAGANGNVALVAAGGAFPDALAAGPAVVVREGVLLLTDRDTLVPQTAAWLEERTGTFEHLKAVGGPAAISDATLRALLSAAGAP